MDSVEKDEEILNVLGTCLEETESDTISLNHDLKQLLMMNDTSNDRTANRSTRTAPSDDSIQNDSNLSSFTKQQYEEIHKAYNNMASKLANTESTIQSLKLHFCSLQAQRDLARKVETQNTRRSSQDSPKKNLFEAELKKLKREVEKSREDLKFAQEQRKKLTEENESLKAQIEINAAAKLSEVVKNEKMEITVNKCVRRANEMKEQLSKEIELRRSLEQSQGDLLGRLEDMEGLLEQERSQLQQVESEYEALKRQHLSLRQQVDEERKLRSNTEDALNFVKQQADNNIGKVDELMTERSLIDTALTQWKKDYLTMETDIKEKSRLIEELNEKHVLISGERDQLAAALRNATTEKQELVAAHEQECRRLHSQYKEQLDAVGTSGIHLERMKTQKLQEKISELSQEIASLESQQKVDDQCVRDQLKQKNAELKRQSAEIEDLRNMQEKALADKESLLTEVNRTVDQLSSERMKLQYELEEAKLECVALKQSRDQMENENVKLLEQLSCMELRSSATSQLQDTVQQLAEEKSSIEQQNNMLKSKLQATHSDIDNLQQYKMETTVLKRQNAAYEAQFTKLNTELNCCKIELQKAQAMQKQQQTQVENMQRELHSYNQIKEALQMSKMDCEQMSETIEKLMEDNRNLKSAFDKATVELDSKEYKIHQIEMQKSHTQRRDEDTVRAYEDKLELVRVQNAKERDLLLQKMKKDQAELKKARDEAMQKASESARNNTELRGKIAELESDLNRQRDQTRSVKNALENSQRNKQALIEQTEKLKSVQQQLEESDKEKKGYMKQNLDQARTISTFVTQISQLESELQDLAKLNDETANIAKHQESLLDSERDDRKRLESKYSSLQQRCKELESRLVDVTLNTSRNQADDVRHDDAKMSTNSQKTPSNNRSNLQLKPSSVKSGPAVSGYRYEAECLNSSMKSIDLESERNRAIETTRRARQMIQESRETMRRLTERMCSIEDERQSSFSTLPEKD